MLKRHIQGLDSIRFICALAVVFAHIMPPPLFFFLDPNSSLARILYGGYSNLVAPGSPAVIVFFLISGFCIHYAYRDKPGFSLTEYYARRYIRVGLPVLAIMATSIIRPVNIDQVLWSLVAEMIYYALYPLLLRAQHRIGWRVILLISYGAVVVLLVVMPLSPGAIYYHAYGYILSPLIGLPCWILGCMLAERVATRAFTVNTRTIWLWRAAVLFATFVCMTLMFQLHVPQYWTLDIFAIGAFFWLEREINYFHAVRPPRFLEWAGQWSYSLYLCHIVIAKLYNDFGIYSPYGRRDTPVSDAPSWLLIFPGVIAGSYLFYLAIEQPAHRLARRFKVVQSVILAEAMPEAADV